MSEVGRARPTGCRGVRPRSLTDPIPALGTGSQCSIVNPVGGVVEGGQDSTVTSRM